MSLLTAEGVMPSTRAAAEKPPRSTTCTKASMSPERLRSVRGIDELNSQLQVGAAF